MDTIETRENLRKMNFDIGGAFASYVFLQILGLEIIRNISLITSPLVIILLMVVLLYVLGLFTYFLLDWMWRYSNSDLLEIAMDEFAAFVRKIFRRK